MKIIVKRRVDGPSAPELGAPTSVVFNSVTVPLARASTGPASIVGYEIQRSTNGTTWVTAASGSSVFGNPTQAYVDGGRLAGTLYYYRARSTDSNGRTSAWSNTVSVTTPVIAGDGYRWKPGVYMRMLNGSSSQWSSLMTQMSGCAGVVGGAVYIHWSRVETSKGVYSWTELDGIVNALTARGKNFIIRCQSRRFGGSSTSFIPSYLNSEGLTYVSDGGQGVASNYGVALWKTAAMDYFIEWNRRVAARYQSNPLFAGVMDEESVFGQNITNGYSAVAFVDEALRCAQVIRNEFPTIPWAMLTNYMNGDDANRTQLKRLMYGLRDIGGCLHNGGPDTHLNYPTWGHAVLYGTNGGYDFRGRHAILSSSEFAEGTAGWTPAQTWDLAQNQIRSNYMIWMAGVPAPNDTAAIAAFLSDGKLTNQVKPTNEVWA